MTRALGVGLGWREELAALALARKDLGFVEIVAEAFPVDRALPLPLTALRRRGVQVVPHGVRLSLGGADEPDPARLAHLAELAVRFEAPLVSEHIAFVRAAGREAGHLLPVPRTRAALDVAVANVAIAMDALPVPLALEPIASLVEWPAPELSEADFITELLERTGALLLLDLANLFANARNGGVDPVAILDRLPLERLAYVHIAGGIEEGGLYHDTHLHPVPPEVLDLLGQLAARQPVPGAMVERDGRFAASLELSSELDAMAVAARPGQGPPQPAPTAGGGRGWRIGAEQRQRLAADQAAVVAALVTGAEPPPGFDLTRVAATASALVEKRAHEVARVLPGLAERLGPGFRNRFAAYAATHPMPPSGSHRADAEAFAAQVAPATSGTDSGLSGTGFPRIPSSARGASRGG